MFETFLDLQWLVFEIMSSKSFDDLFPVWIKLMDTIDELPMISGPSFQRAKEQEGNTFIYDLKDAVMWLMQ